MTIEVLQTLIGSLGFPVACVIALFWALNKEREDHKAEMQQMCDNHKAEMQQMTVAINNNTLALQKLEDVINNGIKN